MVSKASEDLPDPETPLTTVSLPWGMSQEMFFRLCVRAPRMTMKSFARAAKEAPEEDEPEADEPGAAGTCATTLEAFVLDDGELNEFKGKTPV